MSLIATAPGKVMLAGEYAVIDGAPAVLMAVDRRVRARDTGTDQKLSPFLDAVRAAAESFGGDPRRAARIVVDSETLSAPSGTKLGLGSSAAVTAAAAAIALGREASAGSIHALAHHAHRAAQSLRGAKGSGADIATSVHGGVVEVRIGPTGPDAPMVTRPLALPRALQLVFVWTGRAADTASLVARVRALRNSDAPAYRTAIDDIAAAARALAAALSADAEPAAAIAAIAAGARAVAALGQRAGVDLESDIHRQIARRAAEHGGAAKPTGAGAGDIAMAAFASPAAAAAFRATIEADGILSPALRVDLRGTAFA